MNEENAASASGGQMQNGPQVKEPEALWKEPVFRAGISVGLFLTFVGLVTIWGNVVGFRVGLLVVCSGLGIVLGAFGSTATVQWKGVVITGVAATAMILTWMINSMNEEGVVRIRVVGIQPGSKVLFNGDYPYPHYEARGYYEFYVFGPGIRQDRISLHVTGPDEKEIEFQCIPSDAVNKHFGSGRSIQWELRRADNMNVLTQVDGGIVKDGLCDLPIGSFADKAGGRFSPISAAYAQDVSVIDGLVVDLESESPEIRRSARTALGQLGIVSVEPMMEAWRNSKDSYRVSLGVSVALLEGLRSGHSQRADLSLVLTDDDIHLLVSASGSGDRTLRLYASEVLYLLADPRVIDVTGSEFSEMSVSGKFNSIVIIEGTVPYLTDDQKKEARSNLDQWRLQVGPETKRRIDTLAPTLQ